MVPSVKVPSAVNWVVLPFVIDELDAEILIDCNGANAVKFTLVFDAPFNVTVWLAGLNANPALLGVTT